MDSSRIIPELKSIACRTLGIKRACNDDGVIIGFGVELLAGGNTAIRPQEKTTISVHAQSHVSRIVHTPKA
jgi:hypothetical protein